MRMFYYGIGLKGLFKVIRGHV